MICIVMHIRHTHSNLQITTQHVQIWRRKVGKNLKDVIKRCYGGKREGGRREGGGREEGREGGRGRE